MAIELSGYYDESAEPNSYEPIPAGEYRAQIIDAKCEDVSKNNDYGKCLQLSWQVIGGEYEGRLVFQRLNLWGENMRNNALVVQIANSQFAEIRRATGKETPRDTDELLHIPCLIRVAITQDKNKEYDPRNEVKAVKPLSGGGATPAAAANSPRPTGSPPPAAAARPWGQSAPPATTTAPMDDNVPF